LNSCLNYCFGYADKSKKMMKMNDDNDESESCQGPWKQQR